MSYPSALLCEVAVIEREGIDPRNIQSGAKYVGLEHIDSTGAVQYVSVSNGELASTKFSFTPEHILFGKLRPYLRKVARPRFGGICSTDIIPIKPSEKIDRNYLFYFLRQDEVIDKAASLATGVNLPRISPRLLEAFDVPLPPLDEQRRIAAILDQADDLRRKRREALSKLEVIYFATFVEIFGHPVTNPKGWSAHDRLGDVAEIVSGITKGRKLDGATTRVVPYLAVINVQDRALNLATVKTIEATESEIQRYRLFKDDLVLTEGGDPDKLGRGALWHDEIAECIHQNHIFRVRLDQDIANPIFINWLVGGPRGKAYFLRSAKQTTGIASINMTQLREFPLILPPIDLQRAFAARVAEIDKRKAEHRAHLAKLDALFASLQHRAFRGEL